MAIALLTDFGTRDHFVASMKGVISSIAPNVAVFDITHEIPPGNIHAAAFTLFACFRDMPAGTIIVAVVDPGVGSTRRPLAAKADEIYLVGPDNGLFSYIFDTCPDAAIFEITREFSTDKEVSRTFHGRDVFAPAAAYLALGTSMVELGSPVSAAVRLPCIYPEVEGEAIVGRVMHIDRFGNVITSLTADMLAEGLSTEFGGRRIEQVRGNYAESDRDELFFIAGSIGLIEISMNGASAAEKLGIAAGDGLVFRRNTRKPNGTNL
jgi:S-adenosylmethionine hydrolase